MAKPTASKTKPEIVHTVTIEEIHMIPGRLDEETESVPDCVINIRAKSTDPDQKIILIAVPMQSYVDSLPAQYVTAINDFLAKAFGDGIGVDPVTITGDFITQTP
jgi:hypothetical protein